MEEKIRILKNTRPYLLELNFEIDNFKNIQIEETKQKLPTLKILKDNKTFYLHSKFDPLKEAENIIKTWDADRYDIIIILGLGLGYHLQKLYQKLNDKYFIICEYDLNIFNCFLKFTPEELLNEEKIIYLVTEKKINLIENVIKYLIYIKIKKEAKIGIFMHPASFRIYTDFYQNLKNEILKRIAEIYSDYLTVREFKEIWKRNIKQNLKIFHKSKKLIELKNIHSNQPAVIIAAGPSLEKNINFLKENKIIKIAVDTSLRFLIKNNIYPDYVISLDAKYENFNDFKFLKTKNIKLIYDIVTFPKIPLLFNWRYLTYTIKLIPDLYGNFIEYRYEEVEKIIKEHGEIGGLQSGGSVATNALDFAIFVKANPIYFVGLDLSNINFKSHCRETYYNYFYLQRTNKFFNLHTLEFKNIIQRSVKSYIKENNIISEEFILNKYKKWFEDAFKLLNQYNIKINIIT